MNLAQAIVTAILRITGIVILFFAVASYGSKVPRPVTLDEIAQLSPDPETQIKMIDFAGGTVVHFHWLDNTLLLLGVLLLVFSKKLAVLITPPYDKESGF